MSGWRKLIAALTNGELDAQENPLANTVTYGAHKLQRFHTLTNHFYVSRAVLVHRQSFDAMPEDWRDALRCAVREAIVAQRRFRRGRGNHARQQIEDTGCEVIELTDAERRAFQEAVQPVYRETQEAFGGKTVTDILGSR